MKISNPGSKEARELGCTCPVLDNEYGRGIPWPREDGKDPNEFPSFWINTECPIHKEGWDNVYNS